MIVSFRDGWLERFYLTETRPSNVPAELERALFRKLQMLDDATDERDLRVPPSNHFEKLRGSLDGWHSIRVNKRWRLVFQWRDNEASSIYLDDHSYR